MSDETDDQSYWRKVILLITIMFRSAHAVTLKAKEEDWTEEDLREIDNQMKQSNALKEQEILQLPSKETE